jgi:Domain of unknown function (DUF4405)
MNMRKVTSLTALVSFVLLMLTSIILYIVPSGRVAYWSGWKLMLLSKEQWGAVHINLGFLLLIAIILHTYYNWSAIVGYLKNRSKQVRVFTPDFSISLLVTLVVFFGTLAGLPPMNSIIHLGESITEQANLEYGEPPYGHAELSPLKDFSEKVKVELDVGLALLKAAGIQVSGPEQTMKEIAEANGLTPKDLYLTIKPNTAAVAEAMPEEAPGGTGQRTLAQICEMYQLNPEKIVQWLATKNINAELDLSLKDIAAANSVDPHAIYAEIYQLAN